MKKFIISAAVGTMMLAALPVFAENSNSRTPTQLTTVDLACAQTAVNTREAAVIAAVSAHSGSWTAALQARQTALNTAWGLSDTTARRAAINAALKTYKTAHKATQTAFNKAQRDAWTAFKTAAKTCHISSRDDSSGFSLDNR
ncbi:MAG: hypothetical protein ABI643_00310 [Candidatus Doudnabacteria bacterium]